MSALSASRQVAPPPAPSEIASLRQPTVFAIPAGTLTSATGARTAHWAAKRSFQTATAKQSDSDAAWFKHSKHVLVCSWAGRPIYTRYGDENELIELLAVVSALVTNFERFRDKIRMLVAGEHTFIFELCGPIYLLAISKTNESVSQMRAQLRFVHAQMISMLTGNIHAVLESRPNYDIRNLMGASDTLLTDVLAESDSNPGYLLNAYPVLRLNKTTRGRINKELKRGRPAALFGLISAGNRVVTLVHPRGNKLDPSDTLLLLNFVTNSQALRASESWAPLCLPKVSEEGYLYAYVCYIAEEICLTLLSSDQAAFQKLRESKQLIAENLSKQGYLAEIQTAAASADWTTDETDVALSDLRHVLYKSEAHQQFVMSAPLAPYNHPDGYERLFRRYQHLHFRATGGGGQTEGKRHQLYMETTERSTVVTASKEGEYEMYLTLGPLVNKPTIVQAMTRMLRWMKKEEAVLFATD